MPDHLAPGVFVGGASFPPRPIQGVATDTTALLGPTPREREPPGPGESPFVTSLGEYLRAYGDGADVTALSARAFFGNGGRRLLVRRVAGGALPAAVDYRDAITGLADAVPVALVCAPAATELPHDEHLEVLQALRFHCEASADRVALVDPRADADVAGLLAWRGALASSRVALYAPWVRTEQYGGRLLPPSGFVAGAIARSALRRGVQKPPANLELRGAVGFEPELGRAHQDVLNPEGVNVLRSFPGRGHRVWGARTTTTDAEWKYLGVRRTLDYLERSIERGLAWVVFEPNGEPLWAAVRRAITTFLTLGWRDGLLPGAKPDEAFFVRCDRSTVTQADLDAGLLVVEVGVALLRPAEFVAFRLSLATADA